MSHDRASLNVQYLSEPTLINACICECVQNNRFIELIKYCNWILGQAFLMSKLSPAQLSQLIAQIIFTVAADRARINMYESMDFTAWQLHVKTNIFKIEERQLHDRLLDNLGWTPVPLLLMLQQMYPEHTRCNVTATIED
jgi:hypothetical protein